MCLVHRTAKCITKMNGTKTVNEGITVKGMMLHNENKYKKTVHILTVHIFTVHILTVHILTVHILTVHILTAKC